MLNEDSRIYKLFISHVNQDDHEHDLFFTKLNAAYNFQWKDYAVRDKISTPDLVQQMKPVDVVVILSGLISKNETLLKRQLEVAVELKKPLLVIRPYGMENIPSYLEVIAADVVGWNTPCITEAIENISPKTD